MEHNTLCPINTMNKTLNYTAKIYCFCIEEVRGRAFLSLIVKVQNVIVKSYPAFFEKIFYFQGRKSRRERRLLREKRLKGRKVSPPR